MISLNGGSWNNLYEATIKNNPNFQEGVDIVGASPFENPRKKKMKCLKIVASFLCPLPFMTGPLIEMKNSLK